MPRPSRRPSDNGARRTPPSRRLPGRQAAGEGQVGDLDGTPPGPDLWGRAPGSLQSRAEASREAALAFSDADHPYPANRPPDDQPPGPPRRGRDRPRRSRPDESPTRRDDDRRRINGRRKEVEPPDRPRGLAALLPSGSRAAPGSGISDATIARLGAALLWVLVILAAYGGISAWLQSGSAASGDIDVPAPGDVPDGRWAAAGFAERYVTAYLAAGSEGSLLAPYLGYTPDLPPLAEPAASDQPVRTVEVIRGHDERADYWSVTVAVGQPDPETLPDLADLEGTAGEDAGEAADATAPPAETFWQVSVDTGGDQPVAVGLPAPVAGPPNPSRIPLAVTLRQPPTDEPMVESVEGFLAAYLCGGADLDRYVHPDFQQAPASRADTELVPADPPLCSQVEVVRWGAAPARGNENPEVDRQTVVSEVVFDSGGESRRATYGLTLAQRDGRWEIAALLPAPPVREAEEG